MEILILSLLFVLNGLLSMSEIAVVSARKVRLQQLANEGNRGAARALALAEDPSRFLSTIQVGITFVGIFSGAFGYAALASGLAGALSGFPLLAAYSEPMALAIVVVAVAYFSLIVGELVPKRLALQNPERVACHAAEPMRALSMLARPVVSFLSGSTNLVLRLVGAADSRQSPVSEDEIRLLMEQGTRAGVFDETERRLVRNVLLLDKRTVVSGMTPRLDVVFVNLDDAPDVTISKIVNSHHTRFPVCRGSPEEIVGTVHTKDILARKVAGDDIDLEECMQQPLFVPETLSSIRMLEMFKTSALQMALVVDEYGEFQGLVTITDILEAIVGEMRSSHADEEEMIVERGPDSWLIDGMLNVIDLRELLGLHDAPAEGGADYHTLGGMVMIHMGRVPQPAESFEWRGYRFEVVDMDGTRVDKVLVSRLPEEGDIGGG